jgi:hypothetical protein
MMLTGEAKQSPPPAVPHPLILIFSGPKSTPAQNLDTISQVASEICKSEIVADGCAATVVPESVPIQPCFAVGRFDC